MSISPTSFTPVSIQAQVTPTASILSGSATSRTVTALPGGALQVDDTFVRRSIIQPNDWVRSMSAMQAASPCLPCAEAMPAAAPAPMKRKKKKKGFGAKLKSAAKRGLRKLKQVAKGAVKLAVKLHDLPFKLLQATTGLDLRPQTLLGIGPKAY